MQIRSFLTQKTRRTTCIPHRSITEASTVFIGLNLTPYSPKYGLPSHLGRRKLDVCLSIFTRHTISYAFDLSTYLEVDDGSHVTGPQIHEYFRGCHRLAPRPTTNLQKKSQKNPERGEKLNFSPLQCLHVGFAVVLTQLRFFK
jgi:hypothetical protein